MLARGSSMFLLPAFIDTDAYGHHECYVHIWCDGEKVRSTSKDIPARVDLAINSRNNDASVCRRDICCHVEPVALQFEVDMLAVCSIHEADVGLLSADYTSVS